MGPAPRITFPASGGDLFFIEQAQPVARGSGVPGATVRLERFHEEEGVGQKRKTMVGGARSQTHSPQWLPMRVVEVRGEIALKADDSGNPTADVGTHRLRAVQAVPGAAGGEGRIRPELCSQRRNRGHIERELQRMQSEEGTRPARQTTCKSTRYRWAHWRRTRKCSSVFFSESIHGRGAGWL